MRLGEEALAAYEEAGRPPACPRCGGWGGPTLPMCTDPGWEHFESCGRIRWARQECKRCESRGTGHESAKQDAAAPEGHEDATSARGADL